MLALAVTIVVLLGVGGGLVYANKLSSDSKAAESAEMAKKNEATAMKAKENENMAKEDSATTKDNAMMKVGTGYITLADYNADKTKYSGSKKVLFFAASWCPTCQALTKDIEERLSSVPEDTVIIRADYDKETELKRTYGVTYQHTLVQIDNDGKQLTKWNGGNTIETISAKTSND